MSAPPAGTVTVTVEAEGRYDRQQLIPWWDQAMLARARVLVVGAGALGNEILKLLALTGVGHVLIYDMDRIEQSNLSRTVLFRESDEGEFKAEVAARRMREINPDVRTHAVAANVCHAAGLGVFLWADLVVCGLDNRLARVFVNSCCARTGRAWVDGAIESLAGIVRLFDPARTACYECTMNAADRAQLQARRSCAVLARDAAALGHAPTTAVAGSLIAALQVQEAVKYLHGQPTLYGEGLHIEGVWNEFGRLQYRRREDCPGHETLGTFVPLGLGSGDLTFGDLLERAEARLGSGASLDLSRDMVTRLSCDVCGVSERRGAPVGSLREADARCPACGAHRAVEFTGTVTRAGEIDLDLTPAAAGLPPFDVIVARRGLDAGEAWLFDTDAPACLGPLAHTFDPASLALKAA